MPQAYSRLKFLLADRSLTPSELQRQVVQREGALNVKTLYRLADPDRPLERLDLRVVGAVCRTLGISLDDLIVFAEPADNAIQHLPDSTQQRLEELMGQHNEGLLSPHELAELRDLVDEAERVTRANSRRLVDQRRRLRETVQVSQPTATN